MRTTVATPRSRGLGSPERRLLRVRVNESRVGLHPIPEEPGARLEVSTWEGFHVGESVGVEVSLGPLADEVHLDGRVRAVQTREDGRPPRVLIGLERGCVEQVRYVQAVLDGARAATARTHRRVPVDLDIRWTWEHERYASRLADLSRGGAFIVSTKHPEIGTMIGVELRTGGDLLVLSGIVSWIREEGEQPGFGVAFRLPDRDAAARLTEMIREREPTIGR